MCWSNAQFLVSFFCTLLVNLSQPYEYFSFITLETLEPGKKKKNHQNLLCSLHQLSKFPSPYVSFHVYVFHSTLSLNVLVFNMIISHKALEVLMFTRRLYLVSVGSCQVQILFLWISEALLWSTEAAPPFILSYTDPTDKKKVSLMQGF